MKSVADRFGRGNQNTHFMLNDFFSRAAYEIMWKNLVKKDWPQMTIQYDARAVHAG
jgi:hypothetical protein